METHVSTERVKEALDKRIAEEQDFIVCLLSEYRRKLLAEFDELVDSIANEDHELTSNMRDMEAFRKRLEYEDREAIPLSSVKCEFLFEGKDAGHDMTRRLMRNILLRDINAVLSKNDLGTLSMGMFDKIILSAGKCDDPECGLHGEHGLVGQFMPDYVKRLRTYLLAADQDAEEPAIDDGKVDLGELVAEAVEAADEAAEEEAADEAAEEEAFDNLGPEGDFDPV
jgi:hypothetical protein